MANIVFNAVANAVKRLIASFICGRKFKEHLSQSINKCVNVFFVFKPHDLTFFGSCYTISERFKPCH